MTWGSASTGGDSSSVQDQPRNVQQIQANIGAVAAMCDDGSFVTGGIAGLGGGSSAST